MSLVISLFFSVNYLVGYSAEYNGKDLDGEEYQCSAYSYSTSKYYDVSVEFDGDDATLVFANGGSIVLTIDDQEIDDPDSIEAYDYNEGVFWEIDCSDI